MREEPPSPQRGSISMATRQARWGTKAQWELTHRLRSKCRPLLEVAIVPRIRTPTFWELILMGFHSETGVHQGTIMVITPRSVKFHLLIFRTKTKTIIKTNRVVTHSRQCNSNQHFRGERISLRGKDSWTTKLTTPWTSRIKNTTKTGHLCQRIETTHPIRRLCLLWRSQRLQVLLPWIESQSTEWKKMCWATKPYKIVITIITTWASRTVIINSRTLTLTCKISWTEMTKTWTRCQHLRIMRLRSPVSTQLILMARMGSRSQCTSRTTW